MMKFCWLMMSFGTFHRDVVFFYSGGTTSKCLVAVEHQNQVGANIQLLMSTLLPLFFMLNLPNPILKLGVPWVGSPCKPSHPNMLEPKWCFFICKASCKFICVHSKNPYTRLDPGTSTWKVSKSLPSMAKCLEISNCPTSSNYIWWAIKIHFHLVECRKVSFILSSPSSRNPLDG